MALTAMNNFVIVENNLNEEQVEGSFVVERKGTTADNKGVVVSVGKDFDQSLVGKTVWFGHVVCQVGGSNSKQVAIKYEDIIAVE